jgi:hypothetical protein
VTVDNLPAVQTVGGTVSVGNLPTDADGAVRVSSASGRQPLLIDLPTGELLIDCNVPFVSPVVDARGYSRVGIRLDGSSAIGGIIEWRWDGDAPNSFFRVYNANDSNGSPGGDCTGNINSSYGHICAVSGADLRVTVSNPYCNGPNPLRGIKVYLIP